MASFLWAVCGCAGFVVTPVGGPQLKLSGGSLAFGSVTLKKKATRNLTLSSSGVTPLTISSVKVGGAAFALSGASFPATLNPGQSTTFQVTFEPTVAGQASGSITISTDASNEATTTVSLTGTGVLTAIPQLTVSASSLAFGPLAVNSSSTKALTLTSSGDAALTISSVAVTGAGFSISNTTFPTTLNAGQSLTLQVAFDPTVAGAAGGSITISSNSSNGDTATVALSGTGVQAATPQLTVSQTGINFGSVTLNTTSILSLTLTSSGNAALKINSVSVTGSGFTISGATFPTTLNKGHSVTIQVGFDPTVAGPASGSITISSNSGSGTTTTVALSGTGVQAATPQLTVSQASLSFGSVALNTTSTQTLSLASSGNAALTIDSVGITGSGFAISGAAFPATLNPGQSVTLHVSFDPVVAGTVSGSITISSNSGGGATTTVPLSGTGAQAATPKLTVSQSSLSFGSVTVNTTSTQTLTLTSSGNAALTIASVDFMGAGFAISGTTFPTTLNPGQSVILQVTFDPTAAGAASGSITISSDSVSGGTTTVALSGTGVQASAPQLTLSQASLSFGSITVNTTATQTLTLTSSGSAALTINSVGIRGIGFAISGATFPATLNPNQSVSLQVSFDPAVAGAANGSISISSNSASGPTTTVALSGTGVQTAIPQLTVSQASLSFGSVTVNTRSTQTLTLTSSGNAALTISAVGITGAGFAISGARFPTTLNPGQSVALQVAFDPAVAGTASGSITISSNSSTGGTTTVALSGTGAASNPVLTVSTTNLSFGDDPINTPATLSLTLTSTGSSPVTVSSASIAGAGFTFTGATFPVTLNPTIAITIKVQFDPTLTGAASATLSFASNSTTGSPTVVALSGNGTNVQHQVALTWVAPANSPVPVTGYNIYRTTGTSTSFTLLSSSPSTRYTDLQVTATTSYTYYVTSLDSAGAESLPSNQATVTVP